MPSRPIDAELLSGEALYRRAVWSGAECRTCRLHDVCPAPIGPGPAKKKKKKKKRGRRAASGVVLGRSKRFGR